MPRINIDGTDYEVAAGHNLLQACLSLGLRPPVFLLASGNGIGRRVPPVRGEAVP